MWYVCAGSYMNDTCPCVYVGLCNAVALCSHCVEPFDINIFLSMQGSFVISCYSSCNSGLSCLFKQIFLKAVILCRYYRVIGFLWIVCVCVSPHFLVPSPITVCLLQTSVGSGTAVAVQLGDLAELLQL